MHTGVDHTDKENRRCGRDCWRVLPLTYKVVLQSCYYLEVVWPLWMFMMSCVALKTQLCLSSSIFHPSESNVSAFVDVFIPSKLETQCHGTKENRKCAVMSTSPCTGTERPDPFSVSITVNLDDSHVNISVPDHFDMWRMLLISIQAKMTQLCACLSKWD